MMAAMRAESQLTDVLRSIVILSPNEFSFAGTHVAVPAQQQGMAQVAGQQAGMTGMLQAYLYGFAYNRPFTGKLEQRNESAAMHDLTAELVAANAGRERWDAGWQVQHVEASGVLYAAKQGKAHMFWPGQYVALDHSGGAPRPGAVMNVFLAKGTSQFQPGFYVAFSNVVPAQMDQISFVRLYWNTSHPGALRLMHEVTTRLNRYEVPFRLKCLSFAELYDRFDASVLYVVGRDFPFVARLLPEIVKAVRAELREDTPMFTKRLAPGLAFAEDPGTGDSYGFHRCGLVAQGIWNAYMRGLQTDQARSQDINAAFAAAGLDVTKPWLGPGSIDQYEYSAGN